LWTAYILIGEVIDIDAIRVCAVFFDNGKTTEP
jgi:hypothetical protein